MWPADLPVLVPTAETKWWRCPNYEEHKEL